MVCSGAVLLLPVYNQTRDVLAVADIVHLSGALLFVGMAFGHIYMGTLGMRGAYRSMREGVVDETWAKEHHPYWHEDLKAGRAHEASDAPLIAPIAATAATPPQSP
jgi:formate dehydrogenase subunit gamma